MKEREILLKESYPYDYSQLLPIFVYPDESTSQGMYPDMDKVIEKCSEVIERHSMYIRKKEHVKWIDDSYLLIGKARFYKREYNLAEETFLYVYQAYKRNPERYSGLNKLIRTFIETKQWDKAEEFLDLAEDEENKYPEEHLGELYATYAEYYLKRDQDYVKAAEKLDQAIKYTEKIEDKRRYVFILGQIYQKQREFSSATEYYSQVLKLRPNYVMRFNARINRAISLDIASSNADDIKKELNKMLKDVKNEEFRDQIYFALAEIALKEDDEPKAIDLLKLSVKYSTENTKQRALSYYKLANLYFEQPHYINAQAYYDSTLQFLPEEHPDYYDADTKNESLQDLVANLKVIDEQDSLLALSSLPEKERKKKVNSIIKALKEEEERKKQAELKALEQQQLEANNPPIIPSRNQRKGSWYFYNATTLAIGRGEFKTIWGDRPLADNWRRKTKSGSIGIQNEITEVSDSAAKEDSILEAEKFNPDFYLENIPSSIEEQLKSHALITEALFNVGTIFKESFDDHPSAVKSFSRITKEYDTSKFNLPAHYQLYRIYLLEQEQDKMQIEKDWILNNHPFSEYAYLIKNPDYSKQRKETREKVEEFYESTYQLFSYGLYSDVIQSCNKADEVFLTNHLKPQFDLLKAKAIGHTQSKEDFKNALEQIVTDHPDSEVKGVAIQILNYMKSMGMDKPPVAQNIYAYTPNDKHIFVLSFQTNSANTQDIKNKISDFNKTFFREKKLEFTSTSLESKNLFLIRTFPSQKEAMDYYKALQNNLDVQKVLKGEKTVNYIISTENFRKLFKSKDEPNYLTFFKENYIS
jgi:tetratricopeptide (TPR) repeat protein